MSRRLGPLALGLALLALASCRKAPADGGAAARRLPRGDAIWLTDPAAPEAPGLSAQLQRLGTSVLFAPAGTLADQGGRWVLEPAPDGRPEGIPLLLVVRAGPGAPSPLDAAGADPAAIARAIAAAIPGSKESGAPAGRVVGIHLDFPFPPAGAQRYAAIVTALRAQLAPGALVSVTLRSAPATDDERKGFEPLRQSVDAFVAFVFGAGPTVDPAAIDALRVPWWAAYDVTAPGTVLGADGAPRGPAREIDLDRLSGNARIEFVNDLSVNDASFSAFTLVARGPVRLDGLSLEAGDRVTFRVPSLAEMLFRLGSTLAGKRYALGRVIVLGGATDGERLFSLAAFEDVLLGRALSPVLDARVEPLGRSAVLVGAMNRSHHASIASRLANWVEVDLAPARPADVQIGGFDRYETYDAAGRPVTPGRATRVRLFETLVSPEETITPARIVVRGPLPAACCRYRTHLISAAGPEAASDWTAPPPPPTPTKAPAGRKKK